MDVAVAKRAFEIPQDTTVNVAEDDLHIMDAQTLQNTLENRVPPPLDSKHTFIAPSAPARRVRVRTDDTTTTKAEKDNNETDVDNVVQINPRSTSPRSKKVIMTPKSQPLAHFSYTCPGLHDAGSKTLVERWTFTRLLDPESSLRIVIPLFQRAYCWNTTTTVPAWWRDTARAELHSCGKIMFKLHDGDWWCLDGQQRVTTSVLFVAAARDAILRLKSVSPQLDISNKLELFHKILFVDVKAAHDFASSGERIEKGQRILFSRLVPSFCDRQHFFELIIGGIAAAGTDSWLSDTTRSSIQYDTKHYFDGQFQQLVDCASSPQTALEAVALRVKSALSMQLMMIDLQSSANLAQVYQWLQEKSLLSMGALLFNPTPGMSMHACDLVRNFFMSPWTGEPLVEQEQQHAELWLSPIEVPCGGSPAKIDRVLQAVVDKYGIRKPSELETRLITAAQSPAFFKQDLSGLLLYARILTLYETLEAEWKDIIADPMERQKHVSLDIMQEMARIIAAL